MREELDYGAYMNRRLHAWAFVRLQNRVEDKAREAGIPVEYVRPEYTSHRIARKELQPGRDGTRRSARTRSNGYLPSKVVSHDRIRRATSRGFRAI
jgi:hypothetical protein